MKKALFISLLFLSGCSLFVGEDSFGESWTGEHIESLLNQWGDPAKKHINEKGETEVVYKLFNNSCTYYFYTDTAGIITSYQFKSSTFGTCKPIG